VLNSVIPVRLMSDTEMTLDERQALQRFRAMSESLFRSVGSGVTCTAASTSVSLLCIFQVLISGFKSAKSIKWLMYVTVHLLYCPVSQNM